MKHTTVHSCYFIRATSIVLSMKMYNIYNIQGLDSQKVSSLSKISAEILLKSEIFVSAEILLKLRFTKVILAETKISDMF